MAKLMLFGAGNTTRHLFSDRRFQLCLDVQQDEIVGIIDNDIKKRGQFIQGIPIQGIEEVASAAWDYIVISSIYHSEIREQLIDVLHISDERIMNIDDFLNDRFARYQYTRNKDRNEKNNAAYLQKFNPQSAVVYTAIIGDYDQLKEPCFVDENLKYVCFTDNRKLHSDVWEIRYVDIPENMEARHWVRRFKVLPHLFFPGYKTSIWVDASLSILQDLRKYMMWYQKTSDILFFPHYVRDCVYDEGAICMVWKKDNKKDLAAQMHAYYEEGYPEHNGLVQGGCIVRNHNEKKIIRVMEDWWEEICRFSKRDQVSLPYVLDKNKLSYDLCDLYYEDNLWLKNTGHKQKEI